MITTISKLTESDGPIERLEERQTHTLRSDISMVLTLVLLAAAAALVAIGLLAAPLEGFGLAIIAAALAAIVYWYV